MTELLRDNLYEFSKFNRESGADNYFTLPRLQKITRVRSAAESVGVWVPWSRLGVLGLQGGALSRAARRCVGAPEEGR